MRPRANFEPNSIAEPGDGGEFFHLTPFGNAGRGADGLTAGLCEDPEEGCLCPGYLGLVCTCKDYQLAGGRHVCAHLVDLVAARILQPAPSWADATATVETIWEHRWAIDEDASPQEEAEVQREEREDREGEKRGKEMELVPTSSLIPHPSSLPPRDLPGQRLLFDEDGGEDHGPYGRHAESRRKGGRSCRSSR